VVTTGYKLGKYSKYQCEKKVFKLSSFLIDLCMSKYDTTDQCEKYCSLNLENGDGGTSD